MTHPLSPDAPEVVENDAATKAVVFATAERLFALRGFQNVSVRDITTEADVNLASVNYHFGSKDALLFEIFRRRTTAVNRERARWLHQANDRHDGKPPVREILKALFGPLTRWAARDSDMRTSVQFIIRARSEGTAEMREAIASDVSYLPRFADALAKACPHLAPEELYWRLHFALGILHNNRIVEFDRLHLLSGGLTNDDDAEALLERMLDFAEAGFLRP